MNDGGAVGRVRLDALLGAGHSGTVYRGFDLELGCTVAARVLGSGYEIDAEALRRLAREFRVTCELRHPNLVRNLRLSASEPPFLMVMEYVDGPDLEKRLEAQGPLPVPEAVAYGAQIARALGYLHDHGLVHRDVKPSNILVDSSGTARLGDLELVKSFASGSEFPVTTGGVVLGSPGYLALELVLGDGEATPWSDMFALGATLYHLLSGRVPFPGRSPLEVFRRMAREPPPPLGAGVPASLAALIDRLLAREPATRPCRGEEVAKRLEQCMGGS